MNTQHVSKQMITDASSIPMTAFLGVEGGRWVKMDCPLCGHHNMSISKHDETRWACRGCHPRYGNAIDFVRRRDKLGFFPAVRHLVGNAPFLSTDMPAQRLINSSGDEVTRPSLNLRRENYIVKMNKDRLQSDDGTPGREYLLSRGILPETALRFNVGFYANHISIPWYNQDGCLVAVRRRWLNPTGKAKYMVIEGSQLSGNFFGLKGLQGHSNLIIVEGELNAMTLWQIAQDYDVLSIGSETHQITEKMMSQLPSYKRVAIWMDQEEIAKAKAEPLGAIPLWSDKDANDTYRWYNTLAFNEFLTEVI